MSIDLGESQKVAIGVQNTKLGSLIHPVSSPVPLGVKFQERLMPGGRDPLMKVFDVVDKELEVHASTVRSLQGSRFPRPMPGCEHELGALQSDIGMSLIAALLDNFEAQTLDIKGKGLRKIGAEEFWDKRVDYKHVVSAIESSSAPRVGRASSAAEGSA
jgi:hypothetical protein